MKAHTIRKAVTISWSSLFLLFPIQLGKHFWPEWSIILGRRVDYLSPTLYLTDLIALLTLFLYFLFLVIDRSERDAIHAVLQKRTVRLFLIMGFFGIISNCLFSLAPAVTVLSWSRVLLLCVLGCVGIRVLKETKEVVRFFILSLLGASILGFAQYLHSGSLGGIFYWLGERTFSLSTPAVAKFVICLENFSCLEYLRPYATFPHPNVFGGALALGILLLITLPTLYTRWQKTTLGIIFCIVLLLTGSRTAIASLVVILISVFFNKKPSLKAFFLSLGALLLFFVALPFQTSLLQEESLMVRQQLISSAIAIIKTKPIFGVGLGNFLTALPSSLQSREIYFLQPVHNIYVLFVTETGSIGVLLMGIFVVTFRQKIWTVFTSPYFSPTALLLLIGILDHYPLTLHQGQLLLFFSVFLTFFPVLTEKKTLQTIKQ